MTLLQKPADWIWGDLKPLRYGLLSIDPPWAFETWSEQGRDRSASYDTMTLPQLAQLPVMDLARPDALVALWVIDSMLPEGLALLEEWGFRFVTVGFTWVKTFDLFGRQAPRTALLHRAIEDRDWNAFGDALAPMGLGYWTRANPEMCLLASIGAPPRLEKSVRQTLFAPLREHSRKPDEAYRRLERLAPGPRVELFARERRDGWDAWGNQVGFFTEEES
ncbi:MAG: MT-A70 family methyltransferase [Marivibrio sp.]|uniref:MT-A70 family methyltransferase n=1 Tax=Marivibrio sp. TaxID=2039719 RepID=UPI0032EB5660